MKMQSRKKDFVSKLRGEEIVKQEYVGVMHFVSTVKLGTAYDDMNLGKFETMIQGYKGEWLDYQKRCETLEEAKIQHQEAKLYAMKLEESK